MEVRRFREEDYDAICEWWKSWGWSPVPRMFLPETGFVVSNGGVDICAGWLYRTDSAACWAENYISSKDAPRELRKGAVEFLIDELISEAKNAGFVMMMSSVSNPSLIKKLLAAGCQEQYETGMSNLARIL